MRERTQNWKVALIFFKSIQDETVTLKCMQKTSICSIIFDRFGSVVVDLF